MAATNTSKMRNFSIFAALLFSTLAANLHAANSPIWIAATSETIPLEPARLHARQVYYPAVGGAAMRSPGAPANLSFLCVKEHVTTAIYECHLPSERRMIITFRDERRPEKPVLSTIGAILGPGVRQFISPNDLHIQYYNCLQPEFHWRRILDEKYQITTAPKVYSLMTPDHDGQELSVK